MTNLELADKLQAAASNHYGDLCGMLWDGGAALRNLHTENTALRCTEMALKDELKALKQAISEAEPVAHIYVGGIYGNELQDWEIEPEHGLCEKLNEDTYSKGQELKLPLYTLKGIK